MNPAWVAALAALVTLVLTVVAWTARTFWRAVKKADRFLEDWNGVPGDNAHELRPGVMQRLVQLEHAMTDVLGQVHLNSGHSLRDEIQRTEAAVDTLTGKVDNLQDSVDELKKHP